MSESAKVIVHIDLGCCYCQVEQRRLGVPATQLDFQGRARPAIANLYRWRYTSLGDLPGVLAPDGRRRGGRVVPRARGRRRRGKSMSPQLPVNLCQMLPQEPQRRRRGPQECTSGRNVQTLREKLCSRSADALRLPNLAARQGRS